MSDTIEDRISTRIDQSAAKQIAVRPDAGGIAFTNASEMMETAKMLAVSGEMIPKHLRGKPGACLGIIIQAYEWKLSPIQVANKSYFVNDRVAYEAQLVAAVALQRAPIKGRPLYEFKGSGDALVCRVSVEMTEGGSVDYESPPLGQINPKNSPLWKSDPRQQLSYYSIRALCRRHFPDVLLGIYARDELEGSPQIGPDRARDVTPPATPPAEAADGLADAAMEWWVQKIIDAEDINELGQVSQEINRAKLGDHVLAQLRAAFIRRKVQLTPTTQPPPVALASAPPEDEIDLETGEILSEPQGAPPASAEPAPASDAAPSEEAAQPPTRAEYLAYCRDMINARAPDELRAWWNEQAAARKRFRLSPAEESDLKASIKVRIKDAETEATA
jgi:hypothetical protein